VGVAHLSLVVAVALAAAPTLAAASDLAIPAAPVPPTLNAAATGQNVGFQGQDPVLAQADASQADYAASRAEYEASLLAYRSALTKWKNQVDACHMGDAVGCGDPNVKPRVKYFARPTYYPSSAAPVGAPGN